MGGWFRGSWFTVSWIVHLIQIITVVTHPSIYRFPGLHFLALLIGDELAFKPEVQRSWELWVGKVSGHCQVWGDDWKGGSQKQPLHKTLEALVITPAKAIWVTKRKKIQLICSVITFRWGEGLCFNGQSPWMLQTDIMSQGTAKQVPLHDCKGFLVLHLPGWPQTYSWDFGKGIRVNMQKIQRIGHSWNYRSKVGKKTFKREFNHQPSSTTTFTTNLSSGATSTWFWNTSSNGDSTISLGSLFQCLTTLSVIFFPLTANLNLSWCNLRPFKELLMLTSKSNPLPWYQGSLFLAQ